MKNWKLPLIITVVVILAFGLTGCKNGNHKGSCFVYTFRDKETGVWYISTAKGITPRLNADGTLYVSD